MNADFSVTTPGTIRTFSSSICNRRIPFVGAAIFTSIRAEPPNFIMRSSANLVGLEGAIFSGVPLVSYFWVCSV